ncbi:hypothetical protein T492DRAFT_1075989 [Pavlovales sp. CCMP2436]|nr:hypothetical protein T492DRAFT_1075989 [Pavlovales sp. CCMP2436]
MHKIISLVLALAHGIHLVGGYVHLRVHVPARAPLSSGAWRQQLPTRSVLRMEIDPVNFMQALSPTATVAKDPLLYIIAFAGIYVYVDNVKNEIKSETTAAFKKVEKRFEKVDMMSAIDLFVGVLTLVGISFIGGAFIGGWAPLRACPSSAACRLPCPSTARRLPRPR